MKSTSTEPLSSLSAAPLWEQLGEVHVNPVKSTQLALVDLLV